MEMKRRGFVLVLAMVMVMGVSACKGGEAKEEDNLAAVEQEDVQDDPEGAEDQTGDVEEPQGGVGADDELEDGVDGDDVEVGGVDSDLDNFDADMGEVLDFAALIKEAVGEKDLEKLAQLTGFPVYVGLDGVDVVETKEAFLKLDPDEVFSEEMVRSIEKADVGDLAPSMAGFTLMDYDTEGSAGITFGMVDGGLFVTGINYGY